MAINLTKYCHICGDVASAYNLNGLSCQSCKMFFRRNFSKIDKLKCIKNDENCPIDKYTRKCCPKCRLKKCLSIGMKGYRLTSKNNNKLVHRTLELRKLLQELDSEIVFQNNPSSFEDKLSASSRYPSDLNTSELKLMEEIAHASSFMVEMDTLPVVGRVTNSVDAVNLPVFTIRHVIKFCKNISAFKFLSPNDQLTILKPFYFEVTYIRGTYFMDAEHNCILSLENEFGKSAVTIDFDIFNNMFDEKAKQDNKRFICSLYDEIKNEKVIRDLISVLMLFKPREGVTNREYLRYQYFVYSHLLRKYMLHKYVDAKFAVSKYRTLMKLLNQLEQARVWTIQIFAKLDTSQIADIQIDAFDLSD